MGRQAIDLAKLDESARHTAWNAAARELFPGLKVQVDSSEPLRGSIEQVDLGIAQLCSVESAPAQVHYVPDGKHDAEWQHVSLMVQSVGSTTVRHGAGAAVLHEGDMCLIDERERFRLETREYTAILFLRLPREPALSRYPHLDRLFGIVLPSRECGTRLLSDTLLRISEVAGNLGELQRAARKTPRPRRASGSPSRPPPPAATRRGCRRPR